MTTANSTANEGGNGRSLSRQDEVKQKTQQLATLIAIKKEALKLVAGEHFTADRLVKLAQGALARKPELARCTPGSVLVCLMRCAELGLEPDSAMPQKRMWLVPRWNSELRGLECTYVIDYRAKVQLARETGLVKSIVASEVCAQDIFEIAYDVDGTSIQKFKFVPGGQGGVFGERGEEIGYFAAARIEGGEVQVAFMSKKQAEKFRDRHAPRKRSGELMNGPWIKDFTPMAVKTVLNKLWNLLPAGSEKTEAFQQAVRGEIDVEEAGKAVENTAPADLDLGVPEPTDSDFETTEREVEKALGVGTAPAQASGATSAKEPAPAKVEKPAAGDGDDFKLQE